jgi:hypothetical protein
MKGESGSGSARKLEEASRGRQMGYSFKRGGKVLCIDHTDSEYTGKIGTIIEFRVSGKSTIIAVRFEDGNVLCLPHSLLERVKKGKVEKKENSPAGKKKKRKKRRKPFGRRLIISGGGTETNRQKH